MTDLQPHSSSGFFKTRVCRPYLRLFVFTCSTRCRSRFLFPPRRHMYYEDYTGMRFTRFEPCELKVRGEKLTDLQPHSLSRFSKNTGLSNLLPSRDFVCDYSIRCRSRSLFPPRRHTYYEIGTGVSLVTFEVLFFEDSGCLRKMR